MPSPKGNDAYKINAKKAANILVFQEIAKEEENGMNFHHVDSVSTRFDRFFNDFVLTLKPLPKSSAQKQKTKNPPTKQLNTTPKKKSKIESSSNGTKVSATENNFSFDFADTPQEIRPYLKKFFFELSEKL